MLKLESEHQKLRYIKPLPVATDPLELIQAYGIEYSVQVQTGGWMGLVAPGRGS